MLANDPRTAPAFPIVPAQSLSLSPVAGDQNPGRGLALIGDDWPW